MVEEEFLDLLENKNSTQGIIDDFLLRHKVLLVVKNEIPAAAAREPFPPFRLSYSREPVLHTRYRGGNFFTKSPSSVCVENPRVIIINKVTGGQSVYLHA